nr:peroxisome biogenesis factor 10-like [Ipomoea batatas]
MEGNLAGDNLSRVVEEGEDDECGICMESGAANMVLPNCAHSMSIIALHVRYIRSQSCPFCRGSLKRVESGDLWVLTANSDVVDTITLAHHNLKQFYLYIDKLPSVVSETNASFYDYLM